jgi:hypothetical protein
VGLVVPNLPPFQGASLRWEIPRGKNAPAEVSCPFGTEAPAPSPFGAKHRPKAAKLMLTGSRQSPIPVERLFEPAMLDLTQRLIAISPGNQYEASGSTQGAQNRFYKYEEWHTVFQQI